MISKDQLKEQILLTLDTDALCELLGVTTTDLLIAFQDRLNADYNRIAEDFELHCGDM